MRGNIINDGKNTNIVISLTKEFFQPIPNLQIIK